MDLASQLRAAILSASLPPPTSSFITTLVQSRTPPLPLPSLLATARARILAADLTSSSLLDKPSLASLPADLANASIKEARLPRDVHVQVLDIENLSLSRWEQIEELEAVERGERTRGREVIRIVDEGDGNAQDGGVSQATQQQQQNQRAAGKNASHRLVVQDSQGQKVFALELQRVDKLDTTRVAIGEKILLKAGTSVARGLILLTPQNCVLLGGKVDAWHRAWVDGRLTRLKEAATAQPL
jgi:RecQ-mediated genome instability protein 1